MSRLSMLAAALVTAATSLAPVTSVRAADVVAPVYQGGGDPGVCGHKSVLNTISSRFRYQVEHVPNLPNVDIVDFYGIYQTRNQPSTPKWPIARRYCAGTVQLSDGESRPVWYMIEYGQGFASLGDNVEFCVGGFDRWHVYNGYCRVLR